MNQNVIVTLPSKDLRRIARESLRGKWLFVIIGSLIYTALVELPAYSLGFLFKNDFGASIYTILVGGALMYGYMAFLMSFFRNMNAQYGQLISGFEQFVKYMWLSLYTSIFIALWTLLFFIPGIIATYRYSKAFMILVDNPQLTVKQAVDESKRLMKGNVWKNFCLDLSFIGWQFIALIPGSIVSTMYGIQNTAMISGIGNVGGAAGDILAGAVGSSTLFMTQLTLFVLNIGVVAVNAYLQLANIAMYDIMIGNLRDSSAGFTPSDVQPVWNQEPAEFSFVPEIKVPEKEAEYKVDETVETVEEVEAEIVDAEEIEVVDAEEIEVVDAEIVEDKTEE